jgi:hypothetical protein
LPEPPCSSMSGSRVSNAAGLSPENAQQLVTEAWGDFIGQAGQNKEVLAAEFAPLQTMKQFEEWFLPKIEQVDPTDKDKEYSNMMTKQNAQPLEAVNQFLPVTWYYRNNEQIAIVKARAAKADLRFDEVQNFFVDQSGTQTPVDVAKLQPLTPEEEADEKAEVQRRFGPQVNMFWAFISKFISTHEESKMSKPPKRKGEIYWPEMQIDALNAIYKGNEHMIAAQDFFMFMKKFTPKQEKLARKNDFFAKESILGVFWVWYMGFTVPRPVGAFLASRTCTIQNDVAPTQTCPKELLISDSPDNLCWQLVVPHHDGIVAKDREYFNGLCDESDFFNKKKEPFIVNAPEDSLPGILLNGGLSLKVVRTFTNATGQKLLHLHLLQKVDFRRAPADMNAGEDAAEVQATGEAAAAAADAVESADEDEDMGEDEDDAWCPLVDLKNKLQCELEYIVGVKGLRGNTSRWFLGRLFEAFKVTQIAEPFRYLLNGELGGMIDPIWTEIYVAAKRLAETSTALDGFSNALARPGRVDQSVLNFGSMIETAYKKQMSASCTIADIKAFASQVDKLEAIAPADRFMTAIIFLICANFQTNSSGRRHVVGQSWLKMRMNNS